MSNNKDILTLPTFLTYSLGCRTNQAEMEEISLQLTDYGLQTTDYSLQQKEPDLVLLNTCVVTTKAEKETRQKIRELRQKFPKSFLVVLGCAVTAKEKIKIILPEADLFIANKEKNDSVQIILKRFCHSERAKRVEESLSLATRKGSLHFVTHRLVHHFGRDDTLGNKYTLSGRKFIKIQEGCDRFCSFCLTAYLRGKLKSVLPEKVIEEINFWVGKGIKEVILTGINIGLYGNYSDQRSHLSTSSRQGGTSLKERPLDTTITGLVTKILEETKIERISFSSIYPEMLTDDFIKLVVNNPHVSQYFHLSLQSGSPSVLERMNRETDLSRLLNRLKQIKVDNPYFTFRADIITGFPNETEKEFLETLDFIKKTKISFVHVFPYSKRQGTAAYLLPDLPSQVKKERGKRIMETVRKIRSNEAKKMIDKITNCLIVRLLSCYLAEGIMENGWQIKIKDQNAKIKNIKGQIIPVRTNSFENDQLFGEIVVLPTNGCKTSGISKEPSFF